MTAHRTASIVVASALLLPVLNLPLPLLYREAAAESCVVPAGAESPCNAGARLSAAHFLLPREWVDRANAQAELVKVYEEELTICAKKRAQAEADAEHGHSWSTTLVLSSAAFALGLATGVLLTVGL